MTAVEFATHVGRLYARWAHPIAFLARRFIREASRRCTTAPGRVCLDVGAGIAPYRIDIERYWGTEMYLSVDIAPCDSTSLVASAYEVPLRTNTVDLVVSFDVLQHLQDYDKALDEMVRVLRPGGYAIVSVPFVYSECDVHDFRRWTMEGIVCELQKRCLAVELTRYRGGALFVVACWGVWAMQHLLPGQRRDWRSRKDAISILRAFLVVSLSVVPLMLAWCALAIDRVLPRSGSYMGVLVCARKRSA